MSRRKRPQQRRPRIPNSHSESPAKMALHMLKLGYSRQYVALWLWHSSRVEANLDAPVEAPALLTGEAPVIP